MVDNSFILFLLQLRTASGVTPKFLVAKVWRAEIGFLNPPTVECEPSELVPLMGIHSL